MISQQFAATVRRAFQKPLRLVLFGLAILLVIAYAPPVHAATITVVQTSDGPANASDCPGTLCTLRDAIAKANSGDTINFAFTGATIALTNGQLVINKDLTITVVHPCDVTIDAQHNSRIFDVQANKALTLNELCLDNGFVDTSGDGGGIRVAGGASLTLNSVIMLGNRVQGSGPRGGAIYNNGTLSVNGNSDFFQNAAGNLTSNTNTGGAIFNDGAASLNGSTDSAGIRSIVLSNNSAALEGGAIFNNGTMTLSDVSLSSDSAFAGGAIVNNSGVMTLTETLVSSNHADTVGGGLVNEGAGELNVYDSTINGNSATNTGGGIDNDFTMTLIRTTVSNNVSNGDAGGIVNGRVLSLLNVTLANNSAKGDGGGLLNNAPGGSAGLNNVTISQNTADSDNNGSGNGGGILNITGTVNIKNSIMAGNFDTPNNSGPGTIRPDCSGTLTSQGYNLLRINTGCAGLTNGVNGNQVGTSGSPLNAFLDDLADNGGSTQTMALRPASPAIDMGNPLTPGSGGDACQQHDERDFNRGGPLGRCDMGAYERGLFVEMPIIRR